jgi:hypothetical protein
MSTKNERPEVKRDSKPKIDPSKVIRSKVILVREGTNKKVER